MKARRIFYDKTLYPDGAIVEMTIWQLPEASPERPHGLKYSLFYGYPGVRLVGYDNERGKGDHRHVREAEFPYCFRDADSLVADFIADVARIRNESD